METQNTEVMVRLPETTDGKPLPRSSAPIEERNYQLVGWPTADRLLGSGEVIAAARPDLNHDIDRDPRARIRDLTRGQMIVEAISDRKVADYPALAENLENVAQNTRRVTQEIRQSPSPTSVAWVVATLAILGFLTAMLVVGIAISV